MHLFEENGIGSFIKEILFCTLFNIGVFLSILPSFIAEFYEGWQETIIETSRYARIWNDTVFYLFILLFAFLLIVTSNKNLYFKLINVFLITQLVIWVTDNGIPVLRLERTLLSPLKEECYALLEIVPLVAIVYYLIFWGLKSLFYSDFDPQETMVKRIVMIVTIWVGFISPYFLPHMIF